MTEIVDQLGLRPPPAENAAQGLRVAYHSACSMQHGQRLHRVPKALLTAAGFETVEVPEGHICCGSAGTYNLLQPEIAGRLRDRKLANIARTRPDVVATGNIGCITQLVPGSDVPVVHTVELLDWATGGPEPRAMRSGYPARRRARAGISKVSPSAAAPITVGVSQPVRPKASSLSGRPEIDTGDCHRQLADQRAERIRSKPHRRQPQRVIDEAMRDDRD